VRRSRVGQWLVTAVAAATRSLGGSAVVRVTPGAAGGTATRPPAAARACSVPGGSCPPPRASSSSPRDCPAGEATASGCAAVPTYLYAYAAPGFVFRCPAAADGHHAATMCVTTSSPCDSERLIEIAHPCPAAYMNEVSNSWVLVGVSDVPIDPYGQCP